MARYVILGWGVASRAVYRYLSARGERDVSIRLPDDEYDRVAREEGHLPLVRGMEDIAADVVVRSPGIRPDLPAIRTAVAAGARLTSEIELFIDACPAHLYAVTGSDGKTTTATLAHRMLEAAGCTAYLGGNIGVSLLDRLGGMTLNDHVVLEMSSFQLMGYTPSLDAAVVTNLTENHLNWHTDMTEYEGAKRNALVNARRRVENACTMLAPALHPLTFSCRTSNANYHLSNGWLMHGEEPMILASAVMIRGMHNLENILAAAALTDVGSHVAGQVAATFPGVMHRMEYCGTYRGVSCYNSSIDTTPARTAATLAALGGGCTVIVGGAGKNLSWEPLAAALMRYAARVVFTGRTGEEMEGALLAHARGGVCPPHTYIADFSSAVDAALAMTPRDGVLVLSPAATSFDAFSSYTARGDAFRACLKRHLSS